MQYTQEDKEVIEEFLKAKREFSLKSETYVEREGLFGNNRFSLSLSLSLSLPFPFTLSLSCMCIHKFMQKSHC